ncbi:chromosome partitioning protein [Cryobacterium levicorallinum]|uniref:Chromosome partitioning protein n=1 Tax=Cryobacterium levicorallinum TaxID=995038 RepID=A0A4R8VNP6_9MICO|nr:chromosome partitioning protein [Cryobacterium levicorallinum]TFD65023.1 chromosome partitioning protein [Cryobacterium sp. Hh38]
MPDTTADIIAEVQTDTTGEVTINGATRTVTGNDEAGVREEIIGLVVETARTRGQSVLLQVSDEQGDWPLTVHPNGRVESAGPVVVGRHPKPAHTVPLPVQNNSPRPAVPIEADARTPFAALLQPPAAEAAADEPDDEPVSLFESLLAPLAVAVEPRASVGGAERTPSLPVASAPVTSVPVTSVPVTSVPVTSRPATSPFVTSPAAAAAATSTTVPPNLADFLSSRPPAPTGPAEHGWQGAMRRLTGGLVSLAPSPTEQMQRSAISAVQRSLNGPRTIVVLNPKGGAHKTTATLLIAATFGIYRGGYTLAWDNNETMGTLGVRAQAARHTNTAVDLLRDLDRFGDARSRVGDLDNYVRSQGDAQFDALASDLDPAGAASIDDVAFRKLHTTLSRFYRVLVIDTGNNMRASNWEAAVETSDQLVIVSTIREDTGYGAASLLDGLRQKGHADKVAQAVTVLASPSKTADEQLSARLHDHFRQLTRTVVDVPYDASLVGGGPLNVDALAPRTRSAWLQATAAIAEGL